MSVSMYLSHWLIVNYLILETSQAVKGHILTETPGTWFGDLAVTMLNAQNSNP